MNAIIEINGKQYKIESSGEILIDKLSSKSKKLKVEKVLMVWDDKTTKIGNPYLKDGQVEAEIAGDEQGEKINIVKHQPKKRMRKKTGMRPQFTRIKINKISI